MGPYLSLEGKARIAESFEGHNTPRDEITLIARGESPPLPAYQAMP
jgi:hypothetical protein